LYETVAPEVTDTGSHDKKISALFTAAPVVGATDGTKVAPTNVLGELPTAPERNADVVGNVGVDATRATNMLAKAQHAIDASPDTPTTGNELVRPFKHHPHVIAEH
jgi:hypothetical protein